MDLPLGQERFPPLKTISNTNLPRPASSFVGRDKEVSQVVSLLKDSARLLTLTGPGGTGKTRLAIESASVLVPEFRNGVFWVGLAALRDPALVLETVAQTVGARDDLTDHIGERELLLLLDNLEQVVDAAPELAALVEGCPNLRLLVTSRELLRVRGEVEYPVLPLAEPDALDLFRARSGLAADDTVGELCRKLDNLPLTIELAAARTSVLAPAQILERLSKRLNLLKGGRDAEARQQTLRATIEWSHDLLGPEEKTLFARLAVFSGGCTLEAAERVAEADLDTLQSLVDKSLLRHRDDRFWMLETIREYALERLEASGEDEETRRRHAEHFLALAEEAEPHLWASSAEWLDRLGSEHDNLRAALDWMEGSGETQLALRLAGGLWRFWYMRGHNAEGARRLDAVLAADDRPTAARAKTLNGAAATAVNVRRDFATARRLAQEALAIHRLLGDDWGTAYSQFLFGFAAVEEEDYQEARPLLEESVHAFRELGNERMVGTATFNLAWACEELGDVERARALNEENLGRARALSDPRLEAFALDSLAGLARREGRVREGLSLLRQGLPIAQSLLDPIVVADYLSRFALLFALDGRGALAAKLLSCSLRADEDMGITLAGYREKWKEETLGAIRAQLDEAAITEVWEEGRKLTVDQAVALALESDG